MYPKKVTSTIAREGGFLKPHHWFILSPKIDTSYDESMAVFLWTMINHPYCQSYITGVGRFHFIPYYYTTDRFVGLSLYHITNWGREKCHSPIFFTNKPTTHRFLGHWAQPIGFSSGKSTPTEPPDGSADPPPRDLHASRRPGESSCWMIKEWCRNQSSFW